MFPLVCFKSNKLYDDNENNYTVHCNVQYTNKNVMVTNTIVEYLLRLNKTQNKISFSSFIIIFVLLLFISIIL